MNKPNPFIPPLSRDDLPPFMQPAHDRALAVRGDATFIDVMGHAPDVFTWYGDFYQRLFHGGRVPVAMRSLLVIGFRRCTVAPFATRGIDSMPCQRG